MAQFDASDQNKHILMQKMDEELKGFLSVERVDSFKLVEFLNLQGVVTMKDFYHLRLSDLERFVTPIQYSRLKIKYEDHAMEISTSQCLKETKSCQDLMDFDEEGNSHEEKAIYPSFNYKITKDSDGMIGNALIIVNKKFRSGKFREGAEKDMTNLVTMFKNLNVRTQSHFDLVGKDMRKCLEEFATKKDDASIVFVAISTHGDMDNSVLSTDGERIMIDEYINMFQKNKFLIGKPKIFFIQACRGDLLDERIPCHESDNNQQCGPQPESESIDKQTFATNTSDILIAYATSDKHKAWRDGDRGSWFILELRNSFERYPKRNLLEILTITTNVVIQEYKMVKDDQMVTQCCTFHSTLTKFVNLQ